MKKHTYPKPQDVGIKIPPHANEERFCAGFEHALRGKQLTKVEHLKQSFREGFRAAKLYLKDLRKQQGLLQFPIQGRIKIKAKP